MGIAVQSITQQDAQQYNIPVGVYVVEVQQNGVADKAGFKAGDIITAVDGTSVKTFEELQNILYKHKVGDKVNVALWRNGETLNLQVQLQSSANTQ